MIAALVLLLTASAGPDLRHEEGTARHDLARTALSKWASDTPRTRAELEKARGAFVEACRRCAPAATCEDEAGRLERLEPDAPRRSVCP